MYTTYEKTPHFDFCLSFCVTLNFTQWMPSEKLFKILPNLWNVKTTNWKTNVGFRIPKIWKKHFSRVIVSWEYNSYFGRVDAFIQLMICLLSAPSSIFKSYYNCNWFVLWKGNTCSTIFFLKNLFMNKVYYFLIFC